MVDGLGGSNFNKPTSVPVVSKANKSNTKGPMGAAGKCMKGLAWSKQKAEPRRRGPATSLPFESTIELVCVIWHFLPALVIPVQLAMAQRPRTEA